MPKTVIMQLGLNVLNRYHVKTVVHRHNLDLAESCGFRWSLRCRACCWHPKKMTSNFRNFGPNLCSSVRPVPTTAVLPHTQYPLPWCPHYGCPHLLGTVIISQHVVPVTAVLLGLPRFYHGHIPNAAQQLSNIDVTVLSILVRKLLCDIFITIN